MHCIWKAQHNDAEMWWGILKNICEIEINSNDGLFMCLSISEYFRVNATLESGIINVLGLVSSLKQPGSQCSACILVNQKRSLNPVRHR